MAIRGTQILANLFNEPPAAPETATMQKGRNGECIEKRNERLAARYYYYKTFTDKGYTAIIEQLSLEFDLTQETIPRIMQGSLMPVLLKYKNEKPGLAHFRERWHWMKW